MSPTAEEISTLRKFVKLVRRGKSFTEFFIRRFSESEALEASAAIAYYAIISIFPLSMLFIAINSSLLMTGDTQKQVLGAAEEFIPGSRLLVSENINQMVELRGTVGVIGILLLIWSATGVFAGIAQNINQAWKNAPPRHFLIERAMALLMIACLTMFLVTSIIVTATLNLIPQHFPQYSPGFIVQTNLAIAFLMKCFSISIIFVIFILMYKWIPNTPVRWNEAAWGAVIAAIAWETTKNLFIWYLGSGWCSYQIVYGSLAAVIAFLIWLYIGNVIILGGAHISAAIAHHRPTDQAENGGTTPSQG